ncbi:NADPH-dependent FMN reductase (plasmid) [Rhodococcus erythropolis R138]|uniref:NAD(P)H-dependent oxidoreductase n=1 Tax=Rhodococcus erythropolis TaxID=1833 RepID=UPI000691843A|nr:NAD(P)H-dependent oxidoreductase [Rhodococcus erythropolis]ALU73556.1 NADPH-dependent FMN reductase [Rhodococcus erythropolis R138]
MLKICILCGNPKSESRTLGIAEALVKQLLIEGTYDLTIIDLPAHADQIFAWPSNVMSDFIETITECDLLIVASPTYKATYTGMLKAFLDRLPADGLKDIIAIPLMTGGDLTHSMGPEVNLRPLLVELGASIPSRGFYFVMSDMDRVADRIRTWIELNSTSLRRVATISAAISEPSTKTVGA